MRTVKMLLAGLPLLWLHLAVTHPISNAAAQATTDSLHVADSIAANHYAPILWFDAGESYYPTTPFFTAFQWQQRALANADYRSLLSKRCPLELGLEILNHQKAGAFFDLQKIWPDSSWHGLLKAYEAQMGQKSAPPVYIFWDKKEIALKKFQRLVASDHQFWRREKTYRDSLLAMTKKAEPLEVFRYWLYYLNDAGLQGHPQDMEIMFVFVPKAPTRSGALPRPLAVVGAGHTEMVPNNVLLVTPEVRLDSLTIIVERGGHSIAPDRQGDGRFNPGFDANWQAANLWGTRDTQGASGMGALGNYQSWMTFPRDVFDRCMPPRYAKTSRWSYRLVWLEDLKAVYDSIKALPKTALTTPRDSTQWQNFGRGLEKIGGPPAAAWIVVNDSVRLATRERLQNWLKDQWTYEWNLETGRYEKKPSGKLKRNWHQPWLHHHYNRSPLVGFKRHLFPPLGFFDKFFRGFYLGMASKQVFFAQTDLHVTAIPFVKELLNFPGLLVVDAGVSKSENEKRPKLIGRILYDTRYATVFSAYFGWGFETDWKKRERRTGDGDPYFGYDTFKFFYGGLKAEYYIDSLPFAFNFLQIRAGVRIQNKGQELVFVSEKVPPRLELQIGIHR